MGDPSCSGGEKLVARPHIFRTGDELIAVLSKKNTWLMITSTCICINCITWESLSLSLG